mmetsp:Transcript_46736/g.119250  ORF Transcript_46736/g.119250 Transcript_46736/m.119250 type:complete len:122 (-) Transcript_46736:390-755(-)
MIAQYVCEAMHAVANPNVFHRGLAARNILVFRKLNTADPRTVQVADFGLPGKQNYLTTQTDASDSDSLPVRYIPPEVIQRSEWSEKSDVWTFGVSLWETATCMGMTPCTALSESSLRRTLN